MKSATHTDLYYSDPKTFRGRILGTLIWGNSLNQKVVLCRFSNLRLAANINVLRKSGWVISTEMIGVKTCVAVRSAEVARCHMPETARPAAGEEGQNHGLAALREEISRRGN